MVGLVLVSHSAKLAAGAAELARGMAGPDVKIAATGGLALADDTLGTDAELIYHAIEQAYSDDGVLVLMDLGSALLSTEMALEMLAPEQRAHVTLSDAPLVEGAVAAAVQARLGSPIDQVAAEARGALAPKAEHLGAAPATPFEAAAPAVPESAETRHAQFVVRNRLGLHARPAARFVQTAARGEGDVRVKNVTTGRGPVNAKSINAVATLGVHQGNTIQVIASGSNASQVLAAIEALAQANFGDDDAVETPVRAATAPVSAPGSTTGPGFKGLPASPGIALGPARLFRPVLPELPAIPTGTPSAEWEALVAAIDKTRQEINRTREAVSERADAYSAAIFEAHLLFLDDEALRAPARAAVFEQHQSAAVAWQQAVEKVAAEYRSLEDDYMRARATDIETVGRQVLVNLLGAQAEMPTLSGPGILLAEDLSPAETANLDTKLVLGICTALGAPTSHSAILARALGIPAVVGLGEGIMALTDGTPLIVDGEAGLVLPNPDSAATAEYARRADRLKEEAEKARAASAELARTRDGRRIEVAANIGSSADARAAVAAGAEGVGLFRTEFLFLDRHTAPEEEEQYEAYRAAAQVLGTRPLIIRTLDVGGDKPLPYLPIEHEPNPFLGWRAIRLCLARPELYKVQLRAIVRVAAEYPVRVMFPMVATLDEWRAARELFFQARDEVARRGQPVPDWTQMGIMVEIPSAAILADRFAREVDFFSIGTNDLTQYTLAAERGNSRVAALADAFQPAVLQLIDRVVQAAHAHKKWVGVCGELAGEPLAVPVLVGLGVDELSMNAPAIPLAKQIVRGLDTASAQKLARHALELDTPEAIRAYVREARL